MRESLRLRLLVAASILTATDYAQAQTAPAASAASDDQLETITVTAQKRAEDIQTVGLSVQAFTGKSLDELGVKTSSDIAQFTSNVEIALPSGTGNQPLISIRGIGLNDFDTNNAGPNGVYLDEVYLSSPSAQTFATFDLEQVEVLKGPQGTLYGRNTNGGAINLTTVKPSDDFSAYMHGEYGSYNTVNLQGAIGGQIAPTLDGRFAFSANHSDGFMHNLYTGDNENGSNNYAARAMLLSKPFDGMSVLLNLHGGQVNNRPTQYRHIGVFDPNTGAMCSVQAAYGGGCVDLFGYGTPAKFDDGEFNRQQHLRVTTAGAYLKINYNTDLLDFVSISAIDYNMKLHPEDTDMSANRLLEINYGVHSTNVSQEFRLSQTRDRYNWVGGFYYLHENLAQNQPLFFGLDGDAIFGAPGAFDGVAFNAFDTSEQLTDAYALFGQGEYEIIDNLRLIVGGRLNKEHKSFVYNGAVQFQEGGEDNFGPIQQLVPPTPEHLDNSNFSWRVGLNYQITPQLLTYINAATGFKSGDFNGSFLSLDPAEIALQLTPVRPEKVKAYEAGVKSSWFGNRLQANFAAFYNEYRDMQVFELVNSPEPGGLPINVLDNAPKAHTEGVDMHVSAKVTPQLTASFEGGILEAKIDDFLTSRNTTQADYSGNQLPFAPHLSASFMLDYKMQLPTGTLNLQANANYKGHVFFDVGNDPYIQQSGYWIANARAAYDVGHWEAAMFVHNLANKEYYNDKFDLSNPFGFIQGIVGTPRMAGLEVTWRY
jgi:iron complex outermembrane recepter protein